MHEGQKTVTITAGATTTTTTNTTITTTTLCHVTVAQPDFCFGWGTTSSLPPFHLPLPSLPSHYSSPSLRPYPSNPVRSMRELPQRVWVEPRRQTVFGTF